MSCVCATTCLLVAARVAATAVQAPWLQLPFKGLCIAWALWRARSHGERLLRLSAKIVLAQKPMADEPVASLFTCPDRLASNPRRSKEMSHHSVLSNARTNNTPRHSSGELYWLGGSFAA